MSSGVRLIHPQHEQLYVVQVGWRRSGIGLWSASGCRLVCSLRQARAQAGTQTQGLNSLYRAAAPLSLEASPSLDWTVGHCGTSHWPCKHT